MNKKVISVRVYPAHLKEIDEIVEREKKKSVCHRRRMTRSRFIDRAIRNQIKKENDK